MKPAWAGGLPVLDRLPQVARQPLQTFARAAQRGALVNLGTTWDPVVGTSRVHLLSDPERIERLLLDTERFDKDYRVLSPLMGDGLFTAAGPTWRGQRRQLQPAFLRSAHGGFVQAMRTTTDQRLGSWSRPGSLDLAAALSSLTLDIVLRALFGSEATRFEVEVYEGLRASVRLIDERIWLPSLPESWPTPANRALRKAVGRLDAVVAAIVDQRRGQLDRPDLLGLLLAEHPDAADPVQARSVRDQVVTFLLAGHETTASALTWTLYLLDRNPACAARVQDELAGTAGDLPEDLPYLTACFKEATRLYPPVWAFARSARVTCALGPWSLRSGDVVFVSPWLLHRDPQHYPDPLAFRPERHLAPPTWHPFASLPFGGGPRTCIGARFALLEASVVLSRLLRSTRLRFLGEPVASPQLTLYPRGDTRVALS